MKIPLPVDFVTAEIFDENPGQAKLLRPVVYLLAGRAWTVVLRAARQMLRL